MVIEIEKQRGVISRGRQQVAKLCILGHPPLVPLHLPFSSCPFFLKHSDCHLAPPRVIFLERRKPPFSLFLIWLQPKPTVAFPMWASLNQTGELSATSWSIKSVCECLDHTLKNKSAILGWFEVIWRMVVKWKGKIFLPLAARETVWKYLMWCEQMLHKSKLGL